MTDVVQVTMLDVLREPLEEWLNDRGLGLQKMVSEEDTGMDQYVVVIPEGSPLEGFLGG